MSTAQPNSYGTVKRHKLKVYATGKKHKLESLWYSQTPQNTLTQILRKTGHTQFGGI